MEAIRIFRDFRDTEKPAYATYGDQNQSAYKDQNLLIKSCNMITAFTLVLGHLIYLPFLS